MPSKSYWQKMSVRTDRDKEALLSHFGTMAEGLSPYDADVLCDKATDREKKLRAFMTDNKGAKFKLTLSRNKRETVISRTRI